MALKPGILRVLPLYLIAVAVPVSVSVAGIATALALVAAAAVAVREGRSAPWPPAVVLASLAALLGAYALATATAGPLPRVWSKCGEEMWIKLLLVAAPLLAGRSPGHAARAALVASAVGAGAAVYAGWQHWSGWDPIRDRDLTAAAWGHVSVTGFFNHHLSYGGQVAVYISIVAAWGQASRAAGRRRLAALPVLALLLAALVFSHARSAQVGAAAALVLLALLVPGRRRLAAVLLLAAAAGVLAVPANRDHLARLRSADLNATRLNLWRSTADGVAARPLLGWGPGNFEELMAAHEAPGVYDVRGHAHNDFLMHGANAGALGIGAALALLLGTVAVCRRAWRRGGDLAWLPLAAVALQAAITVAGLFQVYQTDDEVEILVYFVTGCALAVAVAGGRADVAVRDFRPAAAPAGQTRTPTEVDP